MKDKTIERLIKAERARQKQVINLIASENYVSKDVLAALGSELNNKYAEGYPGVRYYGGNQVIDEVEKLCQDRALKLYHLKAKDWAVNVQPLSGSPANLAVYAALVPIGGKIMGMALAHGGHLTHGHKVSLTGRVWQQVPYTVDRDSEVIDYEAVKKLALAEKPDIIVAGFTAYPRKIDFAKFREIADAVVYPDGRQGAYLMVDMSHFAGLVAGGAHPSPFPYADVVTSTTHKTLRGPRAALIFARRVPVKPTVTSGNGFAKHSARSAKQGPRFLPDLIDKVVFPGIQGGPHVNQIAGVAVALGEAATPAFKKYTKQIVRNTKAMASELKKLGWRLVSDGTDTHLLLVDTWMNGQGIGGKEASERLEAASIIVNKNAIPFDARSPVDPSGIRIGLAAETTRGRTEKQVRAIAQKINSILRKNYGASHQV